MYFLSLETSTKNFALAISKDDKVLRFRNYPTTQLLENSIISSMDKVLDAAKVPFKDIDAFAIGLGPGSFTSLRVGLSTVKAFAMATNKPVVGICTLDIIAEGVRHLPCDEICVVLDARRNMVYGALFKKTLDGLKLKGEYTLSDLNTLLGRVHGHTLFVGDGLILYRKDIEVAYKACDSSCVAEFAPERYAQVQAKFLAKLALARLVKKDYDDPDRLMPIYLYAQDCQVMPKK